jgi:hypothetical protein
MQMAFFMLYLPVRMYLVAISDNNDIKPSKQNVPYKVFIKYLYLCILYWINKFDFY